MPSIPNHLRPRREKVFGPARGVPLDRNAKARIKVYVQGYNARRGAVHPNTFSTLGTGTVTGAKPRARRVGAVSEERIGIGPMQW